MGMMQNVWSYLLQAAVEVGKDAATIAVRERLTSRTVPLSGTDAREKSGAHDGCPYCAVAKQLGVVFFYLSRASRSPGFGAVYQGLSQRQVAEALAILDTIPGVPDHPTMRLSEQLVQLDIALSRPVSAPPFATLAETVQLLMEEDLILAERFNRSASTGEALAEAVDKRLEALERGPVIDAESRIVE